MATTIERPALLKRRKRRELLGVKPTIERPALLTRVEAAEVLGVKPQTLALWASTGRYGLPVVKVGRCARYRLADLEAFIERRTVGGDEVA